MRFLAGPRPHYRLLEQRSSSYKSGHADGSAGRPPNPPEDPMKRREYQTGYGDARGARLRTREPLQLKRTAQLAGAQSRTGATVTKDVRSGKWASLRKLGAEARKKRTDLLLRGYTESRLPLRLLHLVEADHDKRSWNLGYVHGLRGHRPNPRRARNQRAYMAGYESGGAHAPISSSTERHKEQDTRVLYHVAKQPAQPRPAHSRHARATSQEVSAWERPGRDSVKSGVFLSHDPHRVSLHHGVGGHVYAYRVPEWVISQSGGMKTFDRASELLIPTHLWHHVEFLGKSMDKKDFAQKVARDPTRPGTVLRPYKSEPASESLDFLTPRRLLFTRSPLRLVEAGDPIKKAHDLGRIHAVRYGNQGYRPPSGGPERAAYDAGFYAKLSGQSATSTQPVGAQEPERTESPFKIGLGSFKPFKVSSGSSVPARKPRRAETGTVPLDVPQAPKVHGKAAPPIEPADVGTPDSHSVFGSWLSTDPTIRTLVTNSLQAAADQASDKLREIGHNIGERLGCGMNGCVHASGTKGVIYKLDKGVGEAKLASLVMQDDELQRLSAIPKYQGIYNTGVTDNYTNLPLYAIKREDIGDADEEFRPVFANVYDVFSGIMNHVYNKKPNRDELITHVSDEVSKLQRFVEKGYSEHISNAMRPVFDAFHALAKKGIAPCDLNLGNWGQRANGEIVMRDMGCYTMASDGPTESQTPPAATKPDPWLKLRRGE